MCPKKVCASLTQCDMGTKATRWLLLVWRWGLSCPSAKVLLLLFLSRELLALEVKPRRTHPCIAYSLMLCWRLRATMPCWCWCAPVLPQHLPSQVCTLQ